MLLFSIYLNGNMTTYKWSWIVDFFCNILICDKLCSFVLLISRDYIINSQVEDSAWGNSDALKSTLKCA